MHYLYLTVSFYTALIMLVLFGHNAQAAPLLSTDDAEIVASGHCQIELDQKISRQKNIQASVTPACNFANIEFGLPLSVDDGEQRYALQAKKQIFQGEKLPVAVAASLTWQPKQQQEDDLIQLNIPASFTLNDQVQIDANVGLDHQDHHAEMTWAIASTYSFKEVHGVSLEFFKTEDERTRSQLVYQYQVIPDQVTLFASYGQSLHSSEQSWLGMGLSWVTARSKK